MGFTLGILMTICLASAAPDSITGRVHWKNDVRVPIENDETVDISPSKNKVPSPRGDVKVKLPTGYVGIIQDKLGDRGVIKAINWSNKLRSVVIDFLRHKNFELVEKVEGDDPSRYRRDVSDVKEKKEEEEEEEEKEEEKVEKDVKEKEKEENKKTTLEPSRSVVDPKVLNNETTRPTDQEQMIKIELPGGVHYEKNTKLLPRNGTTYVDILEEDFPLNKVPKNTKTCTNSVRRFDPDKKGEVQSGTSPPSSPNSRKRRNVDEPFAKERIELEKITVQYNRLSQSQKEKFCTYLEKDSIEKPLELLMALLGKVYWKNGEKSAGHWDKVRSISLSKIRGKKVRQKLILKWSCEDDRLSGQDSNFVDALRSMGISRTPSIDGDEEFHSWTKAGFPFIKRQNPRLIVRPILSHRRASKEKLPHEISRPDGSTCNLQPYGGNQIIKRVRLIIDTDEDTIDYDN